MQEHSAGVCHFTRSTHTSFPKEIDLSTLQLITSSLSQTVHSDASIASVNFATLSIASLLTDGI